MFVFVLSSVSVRARADHGFFIPTVLHGLRLIHTDLKPENILLEDVASREVTFKVRICFVYVFLRSAFLDLTFDLRGVYHRGSQRKFSTMPTFD